MNQEIVFTSARHGLRTGSTGFCTVRSTRGMPGNLAQLLERLTGYSHVFDAYGEQAHLNPVNFAHYIARLGDQRLHILARISNAPLDYTNRSNKLAHIVAVDSSNLETEFSEGPAAESLKIPWVTDWTSDTEPYVLADEQQIELPRLDQSKSGSCDAWKAATGDAGWAAVLASSAGETSDPMQVILPRDAGSRAETWALQLVHEALSLIPPARRWDVSYSTFFGGNLPVSINCQWQFILDGTDAAKRARLAPRGRTIDVPTIAAGKIKAPQLPLTPFTDVATRPWDDPQEDATARRRTRVSPDASIRETSGDVPLGENRDTAIDEKRAIVGDPKRTAAVVGVSNRRSRRDRRPFLLHPAILLTIGVVVLVTIGLAVKQFQFGETDAAARIMVEANEKAARREQQDKKQAERDLKKQRDLEAEVRRRQEAGEKEKLLASADNASKNVTGPSETVSGESQPVQEAPSVEPALPPLQDVRERGNRLQIRIPRVGLNSGPDGPIHLAKIYVDSLDHFTLKKIIGGRSVLKSGLDFSLEQHDSKDSPFRAWDVIRRSTSGVNLGGNPDVVGTFRLDLDSGLSFRWHKGNEGFEIINCLLEMEAGDPDGKREQVKCTLREVNRVKPLQFDLTKAGLSEQLVSRNQLTNTQALEMACEFISLPGQVTRKGPTVLRVGDSVKFHIESAQHGNSPRTAEISVMLVEAELDVRIEIEMQLELLDWNRATKESKIQTPKFSPQLMGKVSEQLKEMKNRIEAMRQDREKTQRLADRVQKEAEKDLDEEGKIKEQYKVEIESHRNTVESLEVSLGHWNPAYTQLKQQADDVNQMLDEISTNGQLQFSLRLMIPDAGADGIELVKTDDGVTAE